VGLSEFILVPEDKLVDIREGPAPVLVRRREQSLRTILIERAGGDAEGLGYFCVGETDPGFFGHPLIMFSGRKRQNA
jgi:hypothetical protein